MFGETKFRVKETVTHQGIGGNIIHIDDNVTKTLTCNEVFMQAMQGNWACKNFIDRRSDFKYDFPYKLYYGHVGALGYVVAEDELEEVE